MAHRLQWLARCCTHAAPGIATEPSRAGERLDPTAADPEPERVRASAGTFAAALQRLCFGHVTRGRHVHAPAPAWRQGRRRPPRGRWCPHWFGHPIHRLDAAVQEHVAFRARGPAPWELALVLGLARALGPGLGQQCYASSRTAQRALHAHCARGSRRGGRRACGRRPRLRPAEPRRRQTRAARSGCAQRHHGPRGTRRDQYGGY
mmetsp:Transcript_116298/g.323986  ORF Transcript_116298/g.323986 Transcript_116298/m.323986 type:complete len:205 (+) Transcript_116298:930-1544(+)